jgi:hypothetical protein
LNRKERFPVGLGDFAIEKTIIVVWRSAIELTKKTSKSKRVESRRFLFDGERHLEGPRAILVADPRKAFREPAGPRKQVNNGEFYGHFFFSNE